MSASDNNQFTYIDDDKTRQIVIEGYQAVKALGIEATFRDQKLTEEIISSNDIFKNLCKYIEDNGGSQHSGASLGALCGELNSFFRDPEKHYALWQIKKHINWVNPYL